MAVFRDAAQLYECIGGFFRRAQADPNLGSKVAAAKIKVRFEYIEPEATITVNAKDPASGAGFDVTEGPSAEPVDVFMTMKGDVAHRFWLGKVNLIAAINRGEMKVRGPIQGVIRLLPLLNPAFEMYRNHIKELGHEELL